ncbi:MAG: MFS transporter [Oxalobacteraceae bacterium]|nr:MAG: MFS transporter [Oxalobacteraceae bacterium]
MTPAAWSILSDRFEARRIGRAMSVYNMGPYIGSGLALLLGGVVLRAAETWDLQGVPLLGGMAPWQLTFVVVGTAGLGCAFLLLLIAEPSRKGSAAAAPLPLGKTVRTLWKTRRFYGFFYLGMALAIVPIYGFPAWLPSVATRGFGVPIATVGMHYGTVSLIGGVAGVLLGPNVTALLSTRDAALRLGVITNLLVLACCGLLLAHPSYPALIAIAGAASFFYSMPTSMAAAALQVVTPNRMRGLATSIYIVSVTIMGLAVAPVAVAFCTDRIFRDEARVGDSLALVCGIAALGAAVALIAAMKAYRDLLDASLDQELS